jgi:zinc/manganese transport system ATP-binding protein
MNALAPAAPTLAQLPSAPSDAVRLDRVSLAPGGQTVLEGLDFTVAQGSFVGVLGPNGAGKTTLMRAILGLVPPVAGKIEVLGQPARRGQPQVGYMPQAHAPMAELRLSGRAFVAAAAGSIGWGLPILGRAARQDVDRAIDLVGAGPWAARPVATLSGGQLQLLMLAQALLGQPRLLLLDEPLSGLDPHHQAATIDLVRDIQRRLGIAVLFSAHDLNPLLPVLDQVLYLGNRSGVLGSLADIVTGPVLSRLYGATVDVIHARGRIFVMAGGVALEQDRHVHL